MNPKDKGFLVQEFQEFSKIDPQAVKVPETLLKSLKGRLFPNPWKVFFKISGIHAVVGFLSLGLCNQFGLNPFNTNHSLSDWFMQTAGHSVCMVFCGVFFVATTYLLANLILSVEELNAIRKFKGLQVGLLSIGSLAAFYFFGGQMVLSFTLFWMLGAFLGGFATVEGSYQVRRWAA